MLKKGSSLYWLTSCLYSTLYPSSSHIFLQPMYVLENSVKKLFIKQRLHPSYMRFLICIQICPDLQNASTFHRYPLIYLHSFALLTSTIGNRLKSIRNFIVHGCLQGSKLGLISSSCRAYAHPQSVARTMT